MKAPTVAAIGLPVTGQGRRQNGRLPPCSHRAAIADPVCIAMRLKSTPPPSDPSAASAPAAEPSVQSVAQRGMLGFLLFWLLVMGVLYWAMQMYLKPAGVKVQADGTVAIARDRDGHFRVEGAVNGQPVMFLVDTGRSEEHTSELQSPCNLVCRLLLEKKKKTVNHNIQLYRAPAHDPLTADVLTLKVLSVLACHGPDLMSQFRSEVPPPNSPRHQCTLT